MTEAIYKVGDILEFTEVVQRQFGLWAGPVRGLVVKIIDPGYEYISYRLLLSGTVDTTKNMTLTQAFEKDIIPATKRVGHIDISALLFMENDEPDYEKMMTAFACVESANLRKSLAEETLKRVRAEAECEEKAKENERLSNENRELKTEYFACTEKIKELEDENKALSDTLSKSEAKAQSRLDRNEVLKRENEEVRGYNKELEQVLSESEKKAHFRLNEISSLMHMANELENERDKLKAERDEANHEIDRLRTVVGELNNVINNLNASKSEFSDLFYSLKNALQTNDILEGVNKLEKENERLSNENEKLKAMNDELRSSEKIRKLEEENGKLAQKISCADKLLAEAANRLYQGRAHLNISVHN